LSFFVFGFPLFRPHSLTAIVHSTFPTLLLPFPHSLTHSFLLIPFFSPPLLPCISNRFHPLPFLPSFLLPHPLPPSIFDLPRLLPPSTILSSYPSLSLPPHLHARCSLTSAPFAPLPSFSLLSRPSLLLLPPSLLPPSPLLTFLSFLSAASPLSPPSSPSPGFLSPFLSYPLPFFLPSPPPPSPSLLTATPPHACSLCSPSPSPSFSNPSLPPPPPFLIPSLLLLWIYLLNQFLVLHIFSTHLLYLFSPSLTPQLFPPFPPSTHPPVSPLSTYLSLYLPSSPFSGLPFYPPLFPSPSCPFFIALTVFLALPFLPRHPLIIPPPVFYNLLYPLCHPLLPSLCSLLFPPSPHPALAAFLLSLSPDTSNPPSSPLSLLSFLSSSILLFPVLPPTPLHFSFSYPL